MYVANEVANVNFKLLHDRNDKTRNKNNNHTNDIAAIWLMDSASSVAMESIIN